MSIYPRIFKTNLFKAYTISCQHLSSCNEYIPVPHYKEKSALVIRHNLPNEKNPEKPTFQRIITPDLDLKCLFDADNMYKSALSINLNARHLHLDLIRLKDDYLKMNDLQNKITELELKKSNVSEEVNTLVKTKGKRVKQTTEFKALIQAGNDLKLAINKILTDLIPLQEIVQIACLRLPNSLHVSSLLVHALQSNTDFKPHFSCTNEFLSEENNSIVLFRMNDERLRKSESVTNWKTVLMNGNNWSFIEQSHADNVLNNKYLTGDYAKLEQALTDYVHDKLNYLNNLQKKEDSVGPIFEQIKSVSMFKTAIMEGSGVTPSSNSDVFNIVTFSSSPDSPNHEKFDIDLLHLTGCATLSSMLLNFVRTQIKSKYLPWTVFTSGKSYLPKHGQFSKFTMLSLCADSSKYMFDRNTITSDTNILDIGSILSNKGQTYLDKIRMELKSFVDGSDELNELFRADKSIDELIIDYLKLFVFVYKDFNVPIRFNFLNANELSSNESLKIRIETFLPSEQKYLAVGEVSLLNDYISERLQIRIDTGKNQPIKHISMVNTTLMDISAFLQVVVESNLTKSKICEDTKGNFTFKLPEHLKKFYFE